MTSSTKRISVLAIVFVALAALLGSSTTATAKPTKGSVVVKKKTTKKAKTTKQAKKAPSSAKLTPTTAKPTNRVLSSPTGASPTLKTPPKDVDQNGELSIGFAAPLQSLDPAKNSFTTYTYQLYDRLTTVDDNLNVIPMLASSWTFPNKSTLDMTLRDDVVFEDGTKFDAAAVKANIERSKTLSGSLLATLLKGVGRVEVLSPSVARFHLLSGGADLPSLFSTSAGMMISPKVIASGVSLDSGTKGGGSGPYTVESLDIGNKVVFKQSKMVTDGTYWDKAAGLLKKLTWVFISTSPVRINAVRAGDLDAAQVTGSDVAVAADLVKSGELKGRITVSELTGIMLALRQSRPPLDNKLFRQALQYAVDKNLFVNAVYSGQCDPTSQFYTANSWAFSRSAAAMYRFDHDKAQKMIKDTGLFNPTFTIQYEPLFQAPATAMQGILGDYGINAKLQAVPSGDLSFRDGQADAKLTGATGQVDPGAYINGYMLGNFKLYDDADGGLARLLASASDPTITQKAAATHYDTIFQKIADQAVQVDICHSRQLWIHKGKVANLGELGFTFAGLPDARYLYVRK